MLNINSFRGRNWKTSKMSVVIETTLGDITVDLFTSDRPRACFNFLKLCKIKYYNFNLFHTISRGFIAQTGDPTGSRNGGESIYGVLDGYKKRFFEGENEPRIKHTKIGLISFVGSEDHMIGSQFFLTLGEDLTYLDEKHCVFGEVVEGFDILEVINEVVCDKDDRPYQDVRVTHTVILDDPCPDPNRFIVPSRSPSPSAERLQGGRIAPDEEIDEMEGKAPEEVVEIQAEREAKARATILEMVGDIPDADMAPPENVLFVCKLNPVTSDDDLEIIFSRFGKIKSCEVIRDKKTGDSLQYAFVEFEDKSSCENAYFKMDNVLIDDRRIHVDFSQSVSKVKWKGKGRGVTHYNEKGEKSKHIDGDIGKGNYKLKKNDTNRSNKPKERSRSPKNNEKHGTSSKYQREGSTTKRNSYHDGEHYTKSRNSKQYRSPSSERHSSRYSRPKSNVDRNKSYREELTSERNKSSSKRYKNTSPDRKSSDRTQNYNSSRYRKKSVSPKRKKETSPFRRKRDDNMRSRSRSPLKSSSKRNGNDEKSGTSKHAAASQSTYERKTQKSKRSISEDKKSDSDSDSVSKRKEYNKTDVTSHKSNLKKKSKKKKPKYSSSEDSDSDTEVKRKKSSSVSSSSDSDCVKSTSKKKKSVKKGKRDFSSDSDNYKKRDKKKKKKRSDSN